MLNKDNTQYQDWFERDRAHICLSDMKDNVIFELWDKAVIEFAEDGFKGRHKSWHDALIEYANVHNLKGK